MESPVTLDDLYIVAKTNVAGSMLVSRRLLGRTDAEKIAIKEQAYEDITYRGDPELKWQYGVYSLTNMENAE